MPRARTFVLLWGGSRNGGVPQDAPVVSFPDWARTFENGYKFNRFSPDLSAFAGI
jgi:hypothetical protein